MGKIQVLDEAIINQIAAGEVIENPASVVKELVENSLDAGATRVRVSLTKGGLEEITVIDNGGGMSPEDAILAFKRHATSKISKFSDLLSLRTLGFRGEALPSIAAVSDMEVITRERDSIKGHRIFLNSGEITRSEPAGAPVGTTVRVFRLFHNVPVRFKYLRESGVEYRFCKEILERLALSRPDVSFELVHNGNTIFLTPGTSSLLDTIMVIYGKENARGLVEISPKEFNYVKIKGFTSKPQLSRRSRKYQNFFVNGRSVFNLELNRALKEAYDGLIAPGRFPVAVIFIEINPVHLDVNIHPTKRKVKFSRTEVVTDALRRAVKEVLDVTDKIPEIKTKSNQEIKERTYFKDIYFKPRKKGTVSYSKNYEQDVQNPRMIFPDKETDRIVISHENDISDIAREKFAKEVIKNSFDSGTIIIGQFLNCYILLQKENQLWLIDQHTAHERVNFERLIEKIEKKEKIPRQKLLIPLDIHLSIKEMDILKDGQEILEKLGFKFEEFGGRSVLIRSYPQLKNLSCKELFIDILDLLQEGRKNISPAELLREAITLISCHGAVKAGQKLDKREMEVLITNWLSCEHPWRCPHGRPVVFKLEKSTLDNYFGR